MSDLVVVVPSRGRPKNIDRLLKAWQTTGATADLIVAIDDDDPTGDSYTRGDHLLMGPRAGLAGTLNCLASHYANEYPYVGFMGDDHCPRTERWDAEIATALKNLGTGIIYCNDLYQREALPTAVFMSSKIIQTLEYMCPPEINHLYLDNVWKEWGLGIGRLCYLPHVIIEHLHPVAGKGEWDEGYGRVNSHEAVSAGELALGAYSRESLGTDLTKLRALL